jgi:hypothetical protein
MRPEFDKEFDALLRRTAGGSRIASAAGESRRGAAASPHLDADERAAFAEAALLPAASAAYVAHLADCDECRRAVVGLAAAAGLSFESERREAIAESGAAGGAPAVRRRSWLGALFAPRVLRFAAPALALCLVGVVSFVALRSDRGRAGFDAGPKVEAPPAAIDPATGAPPAESSASANMTANHNSAAPAAASSPANANMAGTGTAGRAGEAGGGAAGVGAGPVVTSTDTRADRPAAADQVAAAGPEGERRQAAATATAPAAAAPEPRDEQRRRQEAASEHDARAASEAVGVTSDRAGRARNNYELQQQTPDGARNRTRSNQVMDGGSAGPPPPPPAPREEAREKSAQPSAPGRAVARRSRDAADENATRTIEGRRFRRAGGVWVDEDYRESLPSAGVRRGTAAYRALVSELPEVGRIAERLPGEVVIVARGRAYRIRP